MNEFNRFFSQALNTFENNVGNLKVGDTINAYNESIDITGICPTITTRPEGFKTAIIVVVK